MVYVIDIQFCVDNMSNYVPKLITIGNLFSPESTYSYYIKLDGSFSTFEASIRTNLWLEKHVHGVKYDDGVESLEQVIKTITCMTSNCKFIYTKGKCKIEFLQSILNPAYIYNLEDYDCPSLKQLLEGIPFYPRDYSYWIVRVLQKWVIGNGHNLPHKKSGERSLCEVQFCGCVCCRYRADQSFCSSSTYC